MTRRALIGHTGFVGQNLQRQGSFDGLYNSGNIESIADRSYDLLVCAGAPGVKWKANQEPEVDLASIQRLIRSLERVAARKLVLISTVDVYPEPRMVDEDTVIEEDAGCAYGRHRLMLENQLRARFDTSVVRLPGLFGEGLRKNVIHDLMTGHRLERIHPGSVFQFYDLSRLWGDLEIVLREGLELVNFATEPLAVAELAREVFDCEPCGKLEAPRVHYDMQSKRAALWGGENGYLWSKREVLAACRGFVSGRR